MQSNYIKRFLLLWVVWLFDRFPDLWIWGCTSTSSFATLSPLLRWAQQWSKKKKSLVCSNCSSQCHCREIATRVRPLRGIWGSLGFVYEFHEVPDWSNCLRSPTSRLRPLIVFWTLKIFATKQFLLAGWRICPYSATNLVCFVHFFNGWSAQHSSKKKTNISSTVGWQGRECQRPRGHSGVCVDEKCAVSKRTRCHWCRDTCNESALAVVIDAIKVVGYKTVNKQVRQ